MLPEDVVRLKLDPSKKIKVEGKTAFFPYMFLGLACFFAILLTILAVSSVKNSADGKLDSKYNMFIIIISIFFAAALATFIGYVVRGIKLKKEVLSMNVTNGLITSLTSEENIVRDKDNHYRERVQSVTLNITYVFYDDEMQKRTGRFSHKFSGEAPEYREGQEVVVAYSNGKCYILKKYTIDESQD